VGRVDETPVPQRRGVGAGVAVGIERINAIMLGRNVNHIVRAEAWDGNIRNIQRLRIHVSVDGLAKDFAEFGLVDVGRSQHGFVRVLTRSVVVVVLRQNENLRVSRYRKKRQKGEQRPASRHANLL
jgi:hypothetical protein